jgi:hypothetical protein
MTLPRKPQPPTGMPPRRARVLLGASQKVGKTTLLGKWAPATTLIVDTHNGSLLLEGEHYVQHVKDWPEFVGTIDDICAGGHPFHTIGLDLVNDLWRFCDWYHGRKKDGVLTPASGMDDYGRSSTKARATFKVQIGRLLSAPVGIWFLTHLTATTDKTGELVVYKPDLDKNVNGYIEGAVDFLWLGEVVNGRRVIHTQPTKHFEAGSRRALPSPLPMDAGEVARAMDRALNPHLYDEAGNRKTADEVPGVVPASEERPVEVKPPDVKDVDRDAGRSDVTPADPWVEEIRPRLEGQDMRSTLTEAGVVVPERVGKWSLVLAAMTPEQRQALERLLLSRLESEADVPWDSEGEVVDQLATEFDATEAAA